MTAQERETDVPGTCWSIAGNKCTWSGCYGPNYECRWNWIRKKGVKTHHCACHYRGVRQETWNGWNKQKAKRVQLRRKCIKFSKTAALACKFCSKPIGLVNPYMWFCRIVSCGTEKLCSGLKRKGSGLSIVMNIGNKKSCATARSLAEEVMMRDDADPREVESAKALMRKSCPRPEKETCR